MVALLQRTAELGLVLEEGEEEEEEKVLVHDTRLQRIVWVEVLRGMTTRGLQLVDSGQHVEKTDKSALRAQSISFLPFTQNE